jgi:AraC family transcriptional regulator of adaptative response / DNA-3-methyladenine glycosylase II
MIPPREQCIRAYQSRDARFDGWFILGVRTTGIYCRPSCPTPVAPKPDNVAFYATAAAAQGAGFRACKRCRPDASPGSPEWNTRADIVGRAMRLIGDGTIDREGVPGLARALAISERHLNRLLVAELGASPLALARAQRAQTARILIETTGMPFGEVALAAGFSSIRQFNDTVRAVFDAPPTRLRHARAKGPRLNGAGSIAVRLPFRAPYDAAALLGFLGARTIPGVETSDGATYRRTMRLPDGTAVVAFQVREDHVACDLRLESLSDLQAALQLDLDADPVAIDAMLGAEPLIGPLVSRRPGLRSPGMIDGTEALVRAVVGQQISVGGARTVLGRIVDVIGTSLTEPVDGLTRVFPSPAQLGDAPDALFAMPGARTAALRETCRRIADGRITLDAGTDRDRVRQELTAVPGIGPWTAEYVAMRALGDPDAFPATDLGVRHGLARLGVTGTPRDVVRHAEAWRPWRAYATHHLWNSLGET